MGRHGADLGGRCLHGVRGTQLGLGKVVSPMPRRGTAIIAVLAALSLAAAACSSTKQPTAATAPSGAPSASASTAQSKYFVQADFDRQME